MMLSSLATDKELLDKLQEIFDDLGKEAGATSFDPEEGWNGVVRILGVVHAAALATDGLVAYEKRMRG
ncbi:hypothetical protein NLG97_g11404 [Lecanicillium saksenae]|uniref:Uncharacterized protein n=1 Tax=Lecanicillium saksenae TaxID=468837 RepID=A0ACC1QAZ5_9HYPO|nr:hypothetical protein NLG97_g11404 [Lecanicillium saksenae]